MLNLEKSIRILEFDKIKELLASLALTQGAKKRASSLTPTSNSISVKRRQTLTNDAKSMSEIKGIPSFNGIPEVLDTIEKAVKNSILSPREILDIGISLQTARGLIEYIRTDAIKPSLLTEIFNSLVPNKTLETRIFKAILGEDLIADDASPALADIRRKIRYQTNRIREILQGYLTGEKSKHLRENLVTMRNGRYVLPVKNEDKNEIKGLIHDTSGTGATLFIEPMAVVEANNELRTLISQESAEIERILAEFSSDIANFSMQLVNNYNSITEIAFYFAMSELSHKMNAVAPEFTDKREIAFERARHPLLDKKKVVPINVSVGNEYNMVVITGPNTGGKTVTLKTLGLFALMAQSGMHLPCDYAKICIFDGVYPDIGDEQSIEQSLSTFSSHMVSIVNIINEATSESLVLFDELGAGTDPIEGAALAQSILEIMLEKSALCAATTHYAELKAFALNTPMVVNASCEFDVNTLKPTYRLVIGAPGKSNAFLISSKLGVSDRIIKRANELISDDTRNFESVIEKLEAERFLLESEKEEYKKLRIEYEQFKLTAEKELKEKLGKAEKESEEMMEKAREIIIGARASAEFIFDKLDKIQKEKDSKDFSSKYSATKKALREKLFDADKVYNPIDDIDENYVLPRQLLKGDKVIIRNIGAEAVLLDNPDKQGNVLVQSGIAKTKTNVKNLMLITDEISEKIQATKPQNTKKTPKKNLSNKEFSPSFDVRGRNIEDAWIEIDKYIDEAILLGVNSVTIVHGKGTGALRKGLWEFFRTDSRIKKYRNGDYGEGDFGVTVLEIK
ncbi:MAG: endonuclease MutS2 [Ruminococcaceae bacterium]|nr:endonuclease MutS2 [Oscillospiraceae bacterium]